MGSSKLPQISGMNMKKSVGVATTYKLTLCTLSLGIHSPKLTMEHGTYVRFGVKNNTPIIDKVERIGSLRVSRLEEKNKSTGGKDLKDSLVGG